MSFKVIETFSGIGAQAKALSNLANKDEKYKYKVVTTVEWELGAIYAYDIIHNGKQQIVKYEAYTKEELLSELSKYNLSNDGKERLPFSSLKRMNEDYLRAILYSINKNNNLVDISSVKATDLPDADLLTYSFPCQDLSISSYWHGNFSGIDKNVKNRSGLLWEIERILKEYKEVNKKLPRFLIMENVTAIQSALHKKNFDLWISELEKLGYESNTQNLNATKYGIPQNRNRTFMLSVYVKDLNDSEYNKVKEFFEHWYIPEIEKKGKLKDFLRVNHNNPKYFEEAKESTPNDTTSRRTIRKDSQILSYGNNVVDTITKTITTKQDRNPNAGIIMHQQNFGNGKINYRNLTPRETFLLMGFDETDFDKLEENNFYVSKSRKILSHSKLLKLAGNSIVVAILETIFKNIIDFKVEHNIN